MCDWYSLECGKVGLQCWLSSLWQLMQFCAQHFLRNIHTINKSAVSITVAPELSVMNVIFVACSEI